MKENKQLSNAETALNMQKETSANHRDKIETLNKLIIEQQSIIDASDLDVGSLYELNATLAELRVDKLSGLKVGNKPKEVQKLIDAEELRLSEINNKRKTLVTITTSTIEALRGRLVTADQDNKESLELEMQLTRQLAVEYAKDCATEYREAARQVKANLDHIRALDKLLEHSGMTTTGILSAGYFELRIPRLLNQDKLSPSGNQFQLVRDTPAAEIDGQALSVMGELLDIDMPLFKPNLVA